MILRQINYKKRRRLEGAGFGRSKQYELSFSLVFSSASLPPASPYTADGTCTLPGENNSGVPWRQQCEPALVSLQSLPVWRGLLLPGLRNGEDRGYPLPTGGGTRGEKRWRRPWQEQLLLLGRSCCPLWSAGRGPESTGPQRQPLLSAQANAGQRHRERSSQSLASGFRTGDAATLGTGSL